jgi:hypothetical protein
VYLDKCYTFRGEEIPNLIMAESMGYLEAPIADRRTVKLKSVKFKLEEMDILLEKILSSPVLTVQKIDAVKTFLLLSIDFLLFNGEVGVTPLQAMDRKFIRAINEDMRIKGCQLNATMRRGETGACPIRAYKKRAMSLPSDCLHK